MGRLNLNHLKLSYPFGVNDLEGQSATYSSIIHATYSPIHLLYMRLLDDDDGDDGEWC